MKMILAMILLALFAKAHGAIPVQVDCQIKRPGFQKYEFNFLFRPMSSHAYIQFDGNVLYAHEVDVVEYESCRYVTLFSHDNKKMTFEFPLKGLRSTKEYAVSVNHGEYQATCINRQQVSL
ncbi:hypothetical protein ACJVC5_14005 [Peredibacter sp. HCB2-198]|uniref:hypothetical protein n=1 Tax=Peredibacter sp. HCB2-198 TaxID=3383025 RepID=UPI0038B5922F